jgi:hypothetical protein
MMIIRQCFSSRKCIISKDISGMKQRGLVAEFPYVLKTIKQHGRFSYVMIIRSDDSRIICNVCYQEEYQWQRVSMLQLILSINKRLFEKLGDWCANA